MASVTLATSEVAVWYCFTNTLDAAALRDLESVLSPEEHARRQRLLFPNDRRDFAAAHGLIRLVLSRYADLPPHAWRFEAAAFGKPSIIAEQAGTPPLTFNLTHTRGLVACAVARGTVIGIDAEGLEARADASEIAPHCFAPSELRQLDACGPEEYTTRFFELWTLKEAYIKAVGGGLSMPLDAFSLSFDSRHLHFAGPDDAAAWQFVLAAPAPDSRVSIAIRRPHPSTNYQVTFSEHGAAPPGSCARVAETATPPS
jgi:4'-phosphopantetheinyl transferase